MNQPESTNESDPAPYDILADLLDIILKFSERGTFSSLAVLQMSVDSLTCATTELADPALPLVCIAALLDVQTISGCTHIFSYLESRVDRLIVVCSSSSITMSVQLTCDSNTKLGHESGQGERIDSPAITQRTSSTTAKIKDRTRRFLWKDSHVPQLEFPVG